jgi:hypothetical protein
MAIRLPDAVRTAVADLIAARVDAGAGPGVMQLRSGAQPADADDAASGTLLATVTFNDPAWVAAVLGVATLDVVPTLDTVGVADDTAGWFRILDSTGAKVMDGDVTATGGGGDLEMDSPVISTGLAVSVTAGTMTEPASA